ncbi:hypothetical protein IWW38_001397 [Coemansia aciculifera]|uniref:Uncharacterized protein n=1 Tax=Coemansia aciculifera TaxID=417176 RepID=A0ACC1M8F4_9FUNG|nr:hypothetical protein IWW38_001397 [Coemansia aciculifera]
MLGATPSLETGEPHSALHLPLESSSSSESPLFNITPSPANQADPLAPMAESTRYDGIDSRQSTPEIVLEDEKPRPYLLKFGPWWQFCSAGDRVLPKTRILPSVAAVLMPVTVLFVLTSVEANWIQAGPGYNGLRLRKATGYVVGNGIATALAFMSALTITMRQIDGLRRHFSLRIALLAQIIVNTLLGFVCILVGALYQRNFINGNLVWITPEYPCFYVGACLALLQVVMLLVDFATTPNFNARGHGYGGVPMQVAIGLANVVAIWTGFGSMIFSSVENKTFWHAYNSCFNAWVMLITTGATVLNIQTVNSKVFVFFWLPLGVLIMFIFCCCFGVGCVQRFDEKPLRRMSETEDQLRAAYRELRRAGRLNRELASLLGKRIDSLQARLEFFQDQRLRLFAVLFVVGVLLKICSWLLGSIIFTLTETNWSYWDSMFFLFLNLLTVGVQGMVPSSSSGMPLYHVYTFVEILSTAAIDIILFHILWNLAPWRRYGVLAKSVLASVTGKMFRRRQIASDVTDLESEHGAAGAPLIGAPSYGAFTQQRAADQLDEAVNVAMRLRALLARKAVDQSDLLEFDRLLQAAESRIDDIRLSEKKAQ